jgi:hypothetical protein
MAYLCISTFSLLFTQPTYLEQGSPDDVGEQEERLRLGGLWEQVAGDVGGGVTSVTVGVGMTAASEAERARTSAPPPGGAEGGDLGASAPQATPGPQGMMDEGTRSTNDEDRCLYAGTQWEAEALPTDGT